MMMMSERKRWTWAAMVVFLACAGLLFHQQIIGSVAYAAEKGKLQASSEELAKVEALSSVFRTVARTVSPSVVSIKSTRESKRTRLPGGLENLPEPLRKFFEERGGELEIPAPAPVAGTGSGVIIDADKGYILTNNHVVENSKRIDVHLMDGRLVEAKLLGADDKTDLALIRIEAERLHAAKLGDSDKMEVGDWVLAIGAPFGLEHTVSQGIISAKNRTAAGLDLQYQDFIQTDAAINPGNSGGPLVNMRGEVIGINTAIATNPLFGGYMGVGFAIPINMAKQILGDLAEGKKIVRGYLGVSIKSLRADPGMAESLGLKEPSGAFVEDVMPRSPAAKADLKYEDVIIKFNGKPVQDNNQLSSMVAATRPGTTVTLTVWRDKKEKDVKVEIAAQPKGFSTRGWPPGARPTPREGGEEVEVESLGMTVSEVTPELAKKYGWDEDTKGVIVTKVDPYGEAASLYIRPGELVDMVQGKSVESPREFERAVTPEALREGVRLRLRDKQGTRTVFLQISGESRDKNKDEP